MKNRIINFLVVCFVSTTGFAETIALLGDTGRNNKDQQLVADALKKSCGSVCTQVFLLGDNVYEQGIASADDPVMDLMFKKHYDSMKIPFRVILGNHDNGMSSGNWVRGHAQVEYSKKNPQFQLPSEFYSFETQDLVVVALDTSRLMWSKDVEAQKKLIDDGYAQAKAKNKWFVVLGHHPYLSNGHHGNAGNFEGVTYPAMISGTDLKLFLDQNVCGKAHFYISGHDHNLQLADANQKGCDMIQILSGSGSGTQGWSGHNKLLFGAIELGFVKMNTSGNEIVLSFENEKNKTLFTTRFKK